MGEVKKMMREGREDRERGKEGGGEKEETKERSE